MEAKHDTIPPMRPVPHSATLKQWPGNERIDDEDGDCVGHVIDHYRAEVVRRYNSHADLLAALRVAARALSSAFDITQNPVIGKAEAEVYAALSRGGAP